MARKHLRSWRPLFTGAGVFVGTAAWLELLWPPVAYFYRQPAGGLLKTLGELLSPTSEIYHEGIFLGWLFLASSAFLLFALPLAVARVLNVITRYVETSEADVSLLKLDLTLRFDDLLHNCTVTREQLFHANQPGTSAYHYNQSVDADEAVIDATTFEMNSRIANERITNDYIIRPNRKKFEAIEVFSRPLPTSLLATYLPDWIVLFLYERTRILERTVVERVGEIVIRGDHDGEHPVFELYSPKRSARNITLTLDFPAAVAPRPQDVKCFIIQDNVVSSIYPRCNPHGDRRVYTAFIPVLDREKVRLQWSNERLKSVKAAMAAKESMPAIELIEPTFIIEQPRRRLRDRLFRNKIAKKSIIPNNNGLKIESQLIEEENMTSTDHV